MTGIGKYIFSILLMIVCLSVLFHESFELGREKYEDWQAEKEYEEMTDVTTEKDDEDSLIDIANLQKINPDIAGWITIPGTKINYPFVKGKDNSFYLTHTVSGKENRSGTIFMDASCNLPLGQIGKNVILYGHNMRSKSMFGSLKELYDPTYSDRVFIKEHPNIIIDTLENRFFYGVFCSRIVKLTEDKKAYTLSFSGEEEWKDYVENAGKNALLYEKREELKQENALLTLSTCTGQGEDYRLLIHAVLLKKEARS